MRPLRRTLQLESLIEAFDSAFTRAMRWHGSSP
jgi:hypothetical protein